MDGLQLILSKTNRIGDTCYQIEIYRRVVTRMYVHSVDECSAGLYVTLLGSMK